MAGGQHFLCMRAVVLVVAVVGCLLFWDSRSVSGQLPMPSFPGVTPGGKTPLLMKCDVTQTRNCKFQMKDGISIIQCGDPKDVTESHPDKFWTTSKLCSQEVKKGTACPADKTVDLSEVEGLATRFVDANGAFTYSSATDTKKERRSLYFYCATDKHDMETRIDFNGGTHSSATSPQLLWASTTLAVVVAALGWHV